METQWKEMRETVRCCRYVMGRGVELCLLHASAPKLLEALKNALELSYRSDNTEAFEILIPLSALKKIEEAIAKAEGRK